MIPLEQLPFLNACLNLSCVLCLAAGWAFIRRRRVTAHKACMLLAAALSALFLVSYLTYHFQIGSVKFQGTGWTRPFYFSILISHTVLAMVNLPLVLTVLWRAWKGEFDRHARLARWTLPIWLYVSVTGVWVYWMLYVWRPS